MISIAEQFKALFGKHLIIDDWQAVDIVLSIVVTHKLQGEMLWLRIIGASGTGKTELLRTLTSQDGYCATIESLTPSAIRRGYKPSSGKELPRMLERIDGKLVITKELAPLLTSHKDGKLEVFGLLRSVHDGELDADYGSDEGHITQKTHFDWILGTTHYIDRQNQLEMQLGSRFIDLRWGKPIDHRAAIVKAMNNEPHLQNIRYELSEAMKQLIASISPTMTESVALGDILTTTNLPDLANLVAILRTPVLRGGYHKEVEDIPATELGTRIGQSFSRIAKGLMLLEVKDYSPYLKRLVWDGLPPLRAAYLRAVKDGATTMTAIADQIGVSNTTVGYIREDLNLLGFNKDKHLALL